MIKKVVVAAMLAASLAAIATPASAARGVRNAPPEPRAETMPEARRNHTWVAGHWQWREDSRRYRWVAGHWVRDRRGYVYNQPNWAERDGRWYMSQGHWKRGDRDRDGIPNRSDRDRDGDGVKNRDDRQPDNPRRN